MQFNVNARIISKEFSIDYFIPTVINQSVYNSDQSCTRPNDNKCCTLIECSMTTFWRLHAHCRDAGYHCKLENIYDICRVNVLSAPDRVGEGEGPVAVSHKQQRLKWCRHTRSADSAAATSREINICYWHCSAMSVWSLCTVHGQSERLNLPHPPVRRILSPPVIFDTQFASPGMPVDAPAADNAFWHILKAT